MLHNLIFAVEWGYFSLMHCFSVISENITTDHILAKSRFFGLHFCCRQYESKFNQFDVTELGEITQNSGHYAIHGHSRSLILVSMESPYATYY